MKGDNVRTKLNKRKIMFSDIINYISLEDDETSSISSSRVPTTPTKARTQSTVPTTPRKVCQACQILLIFQSFVPVKSSTPQKAMRVIDADDGSDMSSDLDAVHMNVRQNFIKHGIFSNNKITPKEKRIEQMRSPARAFAKNESLATPTKRMSTPIADAPQKNKKVC
jgi:hypothetical protein